MEVKKMVGVLNGKVFHLIKDGAVVQCEVETDDECEFTRIFFESDVIFAVMEIKNRFCQSFGSPYDDYELCRTKFEAGDVPEAYKDAKVGECFYCKVIKRELL